MTARDLARGLGAFGLALLASLLGWVALWSWGPLVQAPHRFIEPTLVCAVLVAAVGTAARSVRLSPYVVIAAQLVACLGSLQWHFTPRGAGVLPSPQSFGHFVATLGDGAVAINTYTSPVSQKLPEVFPFLAVCGVALMVSVDALALGVRRAPLAGLPVLLAVTIPISVLTDRLPLAVFGLCALLYLALLTAEEVRRIRGWGRPVTPPEEARAAVTIPFAAGQVGVLTMLGALLVPLFIPVGAGILRPGAGHGPGDGHEGVAIVNPLIDLRRDLVRKTHTPLVYVDTKDPDPSYLRITVLDEFTGGEWRPSQRHLPERNRVDGPLPEAPGLAAGITGDTYNWTLQLGSTFETTWLPTPYPATSVKVGGDWRYDDRTLDIVDVRRSLSSKGLRYTAASFDPALDATTLEAVTSPPGTVAGPETQLPSQLPPVIAQTARQVTKGARTEYQKAIALQEWFRDKGGFTYSTAQAPGSGMDLIARFVTTDKVGYCEQFAASYAVLARTLNIPARVVVGFLHPKKQGPGAYLYTTDELHAWPELYFSGVGWVRFEPTPGARTGASPAYTRKQSGRPAPSATASRKTASPAPARSLPVGPTSTGSSDRKGGVAGWLVLLVVVVLGVLAVTPRLLRLRRRKAWLDPGQTTRDLARGAWAELRATAIDHGLGWPDHRSPRETAARFRARVSSDVLLVRDLDRFVEFIERVRYGRPFEADDEDRAMVRRTVEEWSQAITRASSQRASRTARWLPRSVFERTAPPDPVSSDPEVGVRV